jgi:hypothetical protein
MKFFKYFLALAFISSCSLNITGSFLNKLEKNPNKFVSGTEDVPLLKGMKEVLKETIGFDSTSGSISTTSYRSKNSIYEIKYFYLKTLPEFGWKKITHKGNKIAFERENEDLVIRFEEIPLINNYKTEINFFLSQD